MNSQLDCPRACSITHLRQVCEQCGFFAATTRRKPQCVLAASPRAGARELGDRKQREALGSTSHCEQPLREQYDGHLSSNHGTLVRPKAVLLTLQKHDREGYYVTAFEWIMLTRRAGAATGLSLATPILMMLAVEIVPALLADVVMGPHFGASLTFFPVLLEIILGRLRHLMAGRG